MHQIDQNDLAYAEKYDPTSWVPDVRGARGKINPHLTRFVTKDGQFVDVFHVKPVYYETIHGHWRPLTEVASHVGNHLVVLDNWTQVHPRYIQWLNKRMSLIGGRLLIPSFIPSQFIESLQYARTGHIGGTVTTVYPDPDPETTTIDGRVTADTTSTSWSSVHDLDGTSTGSPWNMITEDTGTTVLIRCDAANTGSALSLTRAIVLFDTSAIGTDTVDSAILSLYGTQKNQTWTVGVVQSSPASNTALATTDFDGFTVHEDTATSTMDSASWSASAYNDFAFDATGEGWIDGGGVTKLGARFEKDYGETSSHSDPPTNTSIVNLRFNSADQTGTSNDPKLVVTHTGAAGPANLKTYDTVATASVKTINGTAIASVKTINTVT